jgi:hypothetical protein
VINAHRSLHQVGVGCSPVSIARSPVIREDDRSSTATGSIRSLTQSGWLPPRFGRLIRP